MSQLAPGADAPPFTLLNQRAEAVSLESLRGVSVLLYFYPKAMTSGCTTQSLLLAEVADQIGDAAIVGISPDSPDRQARFDEKNCLGFDLLSDPDHATAEEYGVWAEKKLYGKTYMGVVRSAFLISPTGTIDAAFYKISPKNTPIKLLGALEAQ